VIMNTRLSAVRELFAYSDWADHEIFELGNSLSDEQLDRQFDLGPGSVRAVLIHIHEAAYWWFGMCRQQDLPEPSQQDGISELKTRWVQTIAARDQMFGGFTAESLERTVTWETSPGQNRSARVIDILYHVAHHSTHHRAQVSNMLRQLGFRPPSLDYLVMRRKKNGS